MYLHPNSRLASGCDDGEEERFEVEDEEIYSMISEDGGNEYDDDSLGSLLVNDLIESAEDRIDVER